MGDIGKQTHIIEYEPLHHDGPECEDCQRPVTADEVTESLASPARRILCEKDTPSADEVTA